VSSRKAARGRRPRPTSRERILTWIGCGVAAVAAAAGGAHPTANRVSDVVVCAAFGAVVAMAASIARSWSWVVSAGIAGAATTGPWAWLALAGVAAAIVTALFPAIPGRRAIGAFVGVVIVQAVMHIDIDRFGASALVGAIAVAPVLVSGWRLTRRTTRTRARKVGGGVLAVSVVILALFAVALLRGRSAVQIGIKRADEGLAAARQGNTDDASALLHRASEEFASAHGHFGGWLGKPAVLLPVVGQQARALDLVSASGAEVADTAATAATQADVQSLEVVNGELDLARVSAMKAPLEGVVTSLSHAERSTRAASSPWLVPPVADRVDSFTQSVSDALYDGQTAADAVAVLPALLGGDAPRHYVVVFATPAETRDLGGFSGAFGELVAENGKLSLVSTAQASVLNDLPGDPTLASPAGYPARYMALSPATFFQNINGTPDFPTVSNVVRELWPQVGGDAPDGVLYVDPYTLGDFLKLSGSVKVNGQQLTAATAATFLLKDQYTQFSVNDDRHDFMADASRTVFDKLTSSHLPGPRKIADVLSPAVQQRRLLAHSFRPEEQALFARIGLGGALPPVGTGDFLSVRSSNLGLDKIDAFLQRSVDYRAQVNPSTGHVDATVTVTLHNTAPGTGLPAYVIGNHDGLPPGTNEQQLAIYTPLRLVDVTSAGQPLGRAAGSEFGRFVYHVIVHVPPQSDLTVTFSLEGEITPGMDYHLVVVPQPLANADDLHVAVSGAAGWVTKGTESASLATANEDFALKVPLRRK
jgi:Protein of unknown function (DUF4012)